MCGWKRKCLRVHITLNLYGHWSGGKTTQYRPSIVLFSVLVSLGAAWNEWAVVSLFSEYHWYHIFLRISLISYIYVSAFRLFSFVFNKYFLWWDFIWCWFFIYSEHFTFIYFLLLRFHYKCAYLGKLMYINISTHECSMFSILKECKWNFCLRLLTEYHIAGKVCQDFRLCTYMHNIYCLSYYCPSP